MAWSSWPSVSFVETRKLLASYLKIMTYPPPLLPACLFGIFNEDTLLGDFQSTGERS